MRIKIQFLAVLGATVVAGCTSVQQAQQAIDGRTRLGYMPHTVACRPSPLSQIDVDLTNWRKAPNGTAPEWKLIVGSTGKVEEHRQKAKAEGFSRLISGSRSKTTVSAVFIYCEIWAR